MQCPGCASPTPQGARFCPGCGCKLAPRCTACGGELAPPARFCAACGTPAVPDTPAPSETSPLEGENRMVTILFADMARSVETTRDLHPEDASNLVNELFTTMVDALVEHGGQVNRFLGDGALGIFGSPRAHENDPERAVLAAVQIRDAAQRLGMNVTIGINTGEVYVGGVGSARYQEQTVIGAPVNLASRLQGLAGPQEILVGEATYRQTCRAFQFSPRWLDVKGLAGPVMAYSLAGALSRPEKVRGIEGLRARLVGRDLELALLTEAVSATVEGRGQVVTVVGEAGIGKSRLLAELRASVAATAPAVLWLEGRCLESGRSVSYAPFVDLLRLWFRCAAQESEAVRRERLAAGLVELFPGGKRETDLLPLLATLLSVGPDPTGGEAAGDAGSLQARNRMLAGLRSFFEALAQRGPVVVLLEDLHWADSLSLDLLSLLMDAVTRLPLMLVCVYRPEREHRCHRIGVQAARKAPGHHIELVLDDLSTAESYSMVASLLGAQSLDSGLREVVLRKCSGNPFFLEEVVRSLIETGMIHRSDDGWSIHDGIAQVPVPETVQSLILSRVDRLAPDLRQVLQHGAVLGRVFGRRALEQMGVGGSELPRMLLELEDLGLLFQERTLPDEEYSFHHGLTHQTIYETILRRRRTGLHARAGEVLEALTAESPEGWYDELARHYALGGRHARAVEYLVRAGQRARQLYANDEAIRYFEHARTLLPRLQPGERDDSTEAALLDGLGDVFFRVGKHGEAESCFAQALGLLPADAPPRRRADLTGKLSDAVHWQGQVRRASAVAEAGLAELGPDRTSVEGVKLLEVLMRSAWAVNDMDNARRYGAELEAVLPRVPYFDSLYMVYYGLAWLEIKSRNPDRAGDWLSAMERVCAERGDENGLARCFHGWGDLSRMTGEREPAAEWFRKSVELAERTGDAHLRLEGYMEWGHLLLLLGRSDAEVEALLAKGMAIAVEMAAAGGVSSVESMCNAIAQAYGARGDNDRAIRYLRHAVEYGPQPPAEERLDRLQELCAAEGRLEEYRELRAHLATLRESAA